MDGRRSEINNKEIDEQLFLVQALLLYRDFLGLEKTVLKENRVKYRRSILVLKPKNGETESLKSIFL